jgi:hypothetical protein
VDKTGDAEAFGITLEPAGEKSKSYHGAIIYLESLVFINHIKSQTQLYQNRLSIESLFFYAFLYLILKSKFKSLSET